MMIKNNKNYHLWVRMHPRLGGVPWSESSFYKSLENKYNNVSIILPESKVSTYALMYNSEKVICYWSLLIPETAYWRLFKPISFVRSDFTELKISIIPKNINHLKKIIFSKNKIIHNLRIKSLRWAKFYLTAGKEIPYLSRYSEKGFKFKKKKIELNFFYYLIYIISKFIEKFLLTNKISYILRRD